MRDSLYDAMPPNDGNPVSSSGCYGARSLLTPGRGEVAPNTEVVSVLPSTVPILTNVTEPSAPPLPSEGSKEVQARHHRTSSVRERANSNHIVETQLAYISNGPFTEELKQKLTQEVVLHATLDSSHSTGGFPGPSAAVTGEASHSDDIRFCNEIQTALKISENTRQPNDPSVQPPVGPMQPIRHLIEACQHKPALEAKLQMLSPYFSHYRPVLGDGNCFYRSFAFGMIESGVHGGLNHLEHCKDNVKACYQEARQWLTTLVRPEIPGHTSFRGRSQQLLSEGYHSFRELLGMIMKTPSRELADPVNTCLDVFQGVKGSSIMHLVRQLTAYEMLSHEEYYATFLPAIEGWWRTLVPQEELSVPLVVGHLVVADGVDAEHVMIQAVATLLRMCLAVVYADGQANPQVHIIGPTRDRHKIEAPSMFLLFRDGHYDLVYPVDDTWKHLVADAGDSRHSQPKLSIEEYMHSSA